MENKINLTDKLAQFSDHWSPKIVGQFNNYVVCYLKSTPECSRLKAAILRLTRVFRDAKVLT
jgi:hypothetical protein